MENSKPLKRIRYQSGMILGADEFATEQNYFLERMRRHNRYLHGWGVVSGLSVSAVDNTLSIAPGMAIDCAGNELLCPGEERCALPDGPGEVWVVIEYCESEVDPSPVSATNDLDGSSMGATRILERARVFIMDVDPCGNHADMGPGSPGCSRPHPLAIARLESREGDLTIIPCARR